jgi:hypothetical protein
LTTAGSVVAWGVLEVFMEEKDECLGWLCVPPAGDGDERDVGEAEPQAIAAKPSEPIVAGAFVFVDNRFVAHGQQPRRLVELAFTGRFDREPAKVRRSMGGTVKLGDFEFARIEVGIELPCYAEDIEAADGFADAWIHKRIIDEVSRVNGESWESLAPKRYDAAPPETPPAASKSRSKSGPKNRIVVDGDDGGI